MVNESSDARRSAVLLEQIRSEVRHIAEGHGTLAKGQEDLGAAIERLDGRIEQLEHAVIDGFKETRGSLRTLATRFDTHLTKAA